MCQTLMKRTIFHVQFSVKKKRKIFEDYLVEMVYRMKSMRTAAEILAK